MSQNFVHRYPKGTFFTLPPRYTVERGAVMRIEVTCWEEPNYPGVSYWFGVHCYWPDGGYRYCPRYRVHNPEQDIHDINDPDDHEAIAMKVLAGLKSDVPSEIAKSRVDYLRRRYEREYLQSRHHMN